MKPNPNPPSHKIIPVQGLRPGVVTICARCGQPVRRDGVWLHYTIRPRTLAAEPDAE